MGPTIAFWHQTGSLTNLPHDLITRDSKVQVVVSLGSYKVLTNDTPCIRLECGKFELTNQDSAGGKNFSVLGRVVQSPIKLTQD